MLYPREGKLVFPVGVAAVTDIKEHEAWKWNVSARYRTSSFCLSVVRNWIPPAIYLKNIYVFAWLP